MGCEVLSAHQTWLGSVDADAAQEIRLKLVPLGRNARSRPLVDRHQPHQPHQAANPLDVYRIPGSMQVPRHLLRAVERRLQELSIDLAASVRGSRPSRHAANDKRSNGRSTPAGTCCAIDRVGWSGWIIRFTPPAGACIAALVPQKSRCHRQLPDLGMQLLDLRGIRRRLRRVAATLEDVRRTFEQCLLPLMHHRRMYAKTARQLRHRLFALQGLERYLCLELGPVLLALRHR